MAGNRKENQCMCPQCQKRRYRHNGKVMPDWLRKMTLRACPCVYCESRRRTRRRWHAKRKPLRKTDALDRLAEEWLIERGFR